jgi:hypothetical protein
LGALQHVRRAHVKLDPFCRVSFLCVCESMRSSSLLQQVGCPLLFFKIVSNEPCSQRRWSRIGVERRQLVGNQTCQKKFGNPSGFADQEVRIRTNPDLYVSESSIDVTVSTLLWSSA